MAAGGGIGARLRSSQTARLGMMSVLVAGAHVLGTLATFGYTLIMARLMEPEAFGLVWTIWSAAFVISNLVTLNLGAVAMAELVRARTEGEDALAAGFISFSRLTMAVFSPLGMLALAGLMAWQHPQVMAENPLAILIGALGVPVLAWQQQNSAQAVALHMPVKAQLPRDLVRPFLFLAVMSALWFAGRRLSPEMAIGLYLCAAVLASGLQFALVRDGFAFMRAAGRDRGRWTSWVQSAVILIPARLISQQLKNVLMLVAALALTTVGVAHMNVALSIVSILNFMVTAVEMVFSSRTSAALVKGNDPRARRLIAASGLLKLVPVVLGAVLLYVFSGWFAGLFGPKYAEAAPATQWLLAIPVARAIFGNTVIVLQIRKRRGIILWTSLVAVAAMVVAAPLVSGGQDVERVAATLAAILVLLFAVQWLLCLRATGIDTSVFSAPLAFGWRGGKENGDSQ